MTYSGRAKPTNLPATGPPGRQWIGGQRIRQPHRHRQLTVLVAESAHPQAGRPHLGQLLPTVERILKHLLNLGILKRVPYYSPHHI